jgi:insertion element IS1 protein InsB
VDRNNSRKMAIYTLASRIINARRVAVNLSWTRHARCLTTHTVGWWNAYSARRFPYRASDRAIGVSIRWLRDFMVAPFAAVPEHLHVPPVTVSRDVLIGCLEVEADELWSFVQKKTKPHWVWIAMDKHTRQVIAFQVGDRSRDSATELWQHIPEAYREQATFYTDQYGAYLGVIPAAQHRAITKHARKTNPIERFNNTLRQRVSRLVRSTLAFSKKVDNHIGAIRYFICHYNLTRTALLV